MRFCEYTWNMNRCIEDLIEKCPEEYFKRCMKRANLKESENIQDFVIRLSAACPNKPFKTKNTKQ